VSEKLVPVAAHAFNFAAERYFFQFEMTQQAGFEARGIADDPRPIVLPAPIRKKLAPFEYTNVDEIAVCHTPEIRARS